VNAAFDAMSAWRIDIANSNEKNSVQAIEKMAAARALGWPEQIVDATRAQLQSITKMQIGMPASARAPNFLDAGPTNSDR
jgi:hypothetical protein